MKILALTSALLLPLGCGDDSGATADASTAGASWSAAPPVPGGGIQETAAVAVDGKIYVLGGFNTSVEEVSQVLVFDTATSMWSQGPALPRPLHHINATVVGDAIYVVGALVGGNFAPVGDVLAWNPKTDAGWTAKTSMPAGSERGAAVTGAIGDVIYVAGGLQAGLVSIASVAAYSTATDTWDTSLPPLPQPADHGCGGVVAGKLYVLGGRYMGNTPLAFEHTPGGAWASKAPMPTARSGVSCGIYNDQIIVAGGELNPNTPTSVWAEVEAYNVTTNTWTTLPPMITPRHGTAGAVVDGALYVPGGATTTGFGAVDTHEVLSIAR